MNVVLNDEDRRAVLKSAKAQPFLVRGLISVAVLAIVSAALGLFTVTQIRTLVKQVDARDIRNDAEASFQRQILHECLLPAQPDQHRPEPKRHAHKCYDQTLGAVLAAQTKQGEAVLVNQAGIKALAQDAATAAVAGKASSDFLTSCFSDPGSACARAQARNQEFIQAQLRELLAKVQQTEFVVRQVQTAPGEPAKFIATPVEPGNPNLHCPPLAVVRDLGIAQGIICQVP